MTKILRKSFLRFEKPVFEINDFFHFSAVILKPLIDELRIISRNPIKLSELPHFTEILYKAVLFKMLLKIEN